MIQGLLLFLMSFHCSHSLDEGWEEFPLTLEEIDLISSKPNPTGRIPVINKKNQSCVLSPTIKISPVCTWRTQRRCKDVPTKRMIPVFSPWCQDYGESGHLGHCKEASEQVPLVHSVEVCAPSGTPDCRGPCRDSCSDYCQPVTESWCETSNTISTIVSETTQCNSTIKGNGTCIGSQMILRLERDVVSTNENCYQKNSQLCAPVNCKIMNITTQCHLRESQVMADLRERECVVCQPTLSETVDIVNICDDVLTDDCQDDPLSQPWTKMCDTESDWSSNGVRFMFGGGGSHEQSHEQIHLSTSTVRTTSSPAGTEDVSDILDFINKQIIAETRESHDNVNFSSKPAKSIPTQKPQTSIYFDPILNTRALNSVTDQGIPPSFTEHLDSMMQRESTFVTPSSWTTFKGNSVKPSSSTTSSPSTTITSKGNMKKKLTPADFLRLCFVSQIGCDFSENMVLDEHVQSLSTTERPPETSTATAVSSAGRDSRNFKSRDKLRDMIRLCFISGICGSMNSEGKEQVEKHTNTSHDLPTTQRSAHNKQASATMSLRERILQNSVEERARACFNEGIC